MKGLEGRRGTDLSLLTSNRTQENSMKHQQGSFKLEIRERFFTERLARHWNRFSREMDMAPTLLEFKMDNTLRYMV